MVVTQMSFMHIRSTLGLIRHIKRQARHLRREIKSIASLVEEEKAARDSGEVERVKQAWQKILSSYTKEETILNRITKEEEIEIREEIKIKKQEEEQVKALLNKLDNQTKQRLNVFFDSLRTAMKEINKEAHAIRKEQRDMERFRTHFTKYLSLKSDRRLARSIRRMAKDEYRKTSLSLKEKSRLDNLTSELEKSLKSNNATAVNRLIEEINKEGGKIRDVLVAEARIIREIMHDINIIHIHLLEKVLDKTPKQIESLMKEGFPRLPLSQIKENYQQLVNLMHSNLRKLYQMARYDERRT
jgi:hypothetical protein